MKENVCEGVTWQAHKCVLRKERDIDKKSIYRRKENDRKSMTWASLKNSEKEND